MLNFTCYGGCVTRDIFNVREIQKHCLCKLTIGQNPISTMFRFGGDIALENFCDSHNFNNRMLYFDANKLALKEMQNNITDYIIIDLICERIRVFVFSFHEKEIWMCKNMPLVETWKRWIDNPKYSGIKKIKDIDTIQLSQDYEKDICRFVRELLKLYPHSRIIYNSVRMAEYYLDESMKIKRFNQDGYHTVILYNDPVYGNLMIKRAERCFLQELCENQNYYENNGIHIIPFPRYTLASKKHHFGLHPLHFYESYYLYAAHALKIILEAENKIEEIKSLQILQKYQEEINKHLIGERLDKEFGGI